MRLVAVVVLLIGVLDAKIVVHPSENGRVSHGVKDVSSKYHVDAHMMDLTEQVAEIPEQTISTKSAPVADLEEDDEEDVTRTVQELPEQTIETTDQGDAAAVPPVHDLEATDDDSVLFGHSEDERHTPPATDKFSDFNGVRSKEPKHDKIQPSGVWGNHGEHLLTTNLPPNFQNNLLKHRKHKPQEVVRADKKLQYDSAKHDNEAIRFTSGGYQINIHQNHAKNFLDARRVQVGTSLLGAHSSKSDNDRVARYRVRFLSPFQKRPIVIVTTVPEGSEKQDDRGPHPDVFAASVTEIRLDHFVVSVVRVDSFPNNGWGQSLYLDWIALEYQSEFPVATYGGEYLQTEPNFPAFSDLEHNQPAPVENDESHSWDE
eukprot:c7705_g1_i1.p1 GENE.c7705_g1_i1~~c7705_g1_i1.p1  ORF type:complete len:382 (+),score=111.65 c7705_g1_i1:29-1147(+)